MTSYVMLCSFRNKLVQELIKTLPGKCRNSQFVNISQDAFALRKRYVTKKIAFYLRQQVNNIVNSMQLSSISFQYCTRLHCFISISKCLEHDQVELQLFRQFNIYHKPIYLLHNSSVFLTFSFDDVICHGLGHRDNLHYK